MFVQRKGKACLAATLLAAVVISGHPRLTQAADISQYLSPEFCAVLVIHPQRIGQSTLAEAAKAGLPKSFVSADPVAMFTDFLKKQKDNPPGFDADKLAKLLVGKQVHRIAMFIDAMPMKNVAALPAIVVQFAEDVNTDGVVSALSNTWESAEVDGVKYKKMKGPKAVDPDMAALAPDNRTLVLALNMTMLKMLVKEQGERPLLQQLQKASFDNDIVFEFYAQPMWAAVAKATGKTTDEVIAAAVPSPMVADTVKDVKSVSIRLNFSGKTLLHGEAATGKPESANFMAVVGQQMKSSGKKQFEEVKKNPPGMAALVMPMVSKVGDEIFEKLEIKTEGSQLTVNLPMPDALPDALKAIGQVVAPFLPPAPKAGE